MEGSTEKRGVLTFHEFLENKARFELFLNYLKTEFSSENLLFWRQVEQLHQLTPTSPHLDETVLTIFRQFVQINSPYQINLPYELRDELAQTLFQYIQIENNNNNKNNNNAEKKKINPSL